MTNIEEVLKEFDERFGEDYLVKICEDADGELWEVQDFIKDSILSVAEGLVPGEVDESQSKMAEILGGLDRKSQWNACRNTILKNIAKLKGKV